MADQTLTEASLEVLASQRRVIEQIREVAFPDQIGQPIEQDAMRRLLTLAEEQAVARIAPVPTDVPGLRELSDAASPDWTMTGQGAIAWTVREGPRGAQIGNFICEEDAAFAVAAVAFTRAALAAFGDAPREPTSGFERGYRTGYEAALRDKEMNRE